MSANPESNLLLTDAEEIECLNVIETIMQHANKINRHNEAIGALLWQLKYRLLGEDGKVVSDNFRKHMSSIFEKQMKLHNMGDRISFHEVCKWLNELGFFESVQSLYNRVWAYEQKIIVQEGLGVDLSEFKISDHTLRELRKVPEKHQKEVLEVAIHDISNGNTKITARSIQQAREIVFNKEIHTPYVKLPEKKISKPRLETETLTITKQELDELIQKAVLEYQINIKEELIGMKVALTEQAKENAKSELAAEINYLKETKDGLYKKLQKALAEIERLRKEVEDQRIHLAS